MTIRKHSKTVLIVSMSGGKDSVYMLGYLRAKYPTVRIIAVYADTGFEHVKPVSAEDWARERCAAFGVELYVVRNANKTFLEMVEMRHETRPNVPCWPAPGERQCTSDLKRDPINTWIREMVKTGVITEKRIVICTGIRAAESDGRLARCCHKDENGEPGKGPRKKIVFSINERLTRNRKGGKLTKRSGMFGVQVIEWYPIAFASLADVLDWHKATNTPMHPVYTYAGGYLKRFSCRVCIFSTKADLHAIYKHDREAFDAVAAIEARTGWAMKTSGDTLLKIIGQELTDFSQYGSEEVYDRPCM